MFIRRFNTDFLSRMYSQNHPFGVILPGIVGAGKTSMIEQLCEVLTLQGFQLISFDGDDSRFRTQVRESSRLILDEIQSKGLQRPFVYVDEVQKEQAIFDAIKISFDKVSASFIVSGSNPALLRTTSNDRLQRRALVVPQFPLSISEIIADLELVPKKHQREEFMELLSGEKSLANLKLSECKPSDDIDQIVRRYLVVGGLPQAWLARDSAQAFRAIKMVAERGITETYQTTIAVDDEIRRFLAEKNSQEFTYKGVQQTLRTSKRFVVDKVIDHLLNHGYIFKKTPFLGEYGVSHKTYFSAYSWVDPGIVSYYTTQNPSAQEMGFRLESYVHTRLIDHLSHVPLKSSIYYYKPFSIKKSNNSLSFEDGELDFVVQIGRSVLPLEVKMTARMRELDTSLLEKFVRDYQCPYGVVLYGGAPHVDIERKIVFYPYWLI